MYRPGLARWEDLPFVRPCVGVCLAGLLALGSTGPAAADSVQGGALDQFLAESSTSIKGVKGLCEGECCSTSMMIHTLAHPEKSKDNHARDLGLLLLKVSGRLPQMPVEIHEPIIPTGIKAAPAPTTSPSPSFSLPTPTPKAPISAVKSTVSKTIAPIKEAGKKV